MCTVPQVWSPMHCVHKRVHSICTMCIIECTPYAQCAHVCTPGALFAELWSPMYCVAQVSELNMHYVHNRVQSMCTVCTPGARFAEVWSPMYCVAQVSALHMHYVHNRVHSMCTVCTCVHSRCTLDRRVVSNALCCKSECTPYALCA